MYVIRSIENFHATETTSLDLLVEQNNKLNEILQKAVSLDGETVDKLWKFKEWC